MIYFSTFITGFNELIEKELKRIFKDIKIEKLLDGLIIYETSSPMDQIRELKLYSNSFVLLFERENINVNFPDRLVKIVLRDFDFNLMKFGNKKSKFRVVISKENEIVKIDNNLIKDVESKISKDKNYLLDKANPDLEFWFLIRSEKIGLFGVRITKHPDYKKVLQKGELRPELASLLCLMSEPKVTDIFLDPFSGIGSIGKARVNFPYKKIISSDIDTRDATNMKDLKNNSIDKIVTDPPWGIFEKTIDLTNLYSKMLVEFGRVVKSKGILVILVANKELFESILENFKTYLKLKEKYNILVSGKKAGVYKISKI